MSQQTSAAAKSRNLDLDDAVADAERRYRAANPESFRRWEEAARSMPGGNTRTVLFYSPYPLTLVSGDRQTLTDADGHRYIDFLGEYSAGLYGHSDPVIRRAIEAALADGIVLGGPNRYEAGLAAEICRRFPSLELVRFCNSGTEANLFALSLARIVTGRDKVMVFDGAYHGGVLYFGHGISPLNVPIPWVVAPYNRTAETLALIEQNAGQLAAVLIEPMQGSGGCLPADRDFLAALREACTKHGIVLVFDEVMTSRVSPGGVQALLGITPDMTTLGKYLGGGISFGAFGGKAALMERLDPRRPDAISHAGTFNNNVLGMAAGLAGLKELLTEAESRRINREGDRLRDRLNGLGRARGLPLQVTGVGSLLGLHFARRPVRSVHDLEAGDADQGRRREQLMKLFHLDMLDQGIYLARRGYVTLSLPMGEADFDRLAQAVDEFLELRGPLIETAITA
jgi:glutamate-1-semialdehyde 2,1-aminomutase